MTWPDIFLLCFSVGALWSLATLLLGGAHLNHGHSAGGHAIHGHHGAHVHHGSGHHGTGHHGPSMPPWLASMINPSGVAVFLAWFGGIGYLLTRHTGWQFWADMTVAIAAGLTGVWLLARFLTFLESREKPMNPADYEMVGVLGRVSCPIRSDGVGELIFIRDGARKPAAARSEDGNAIGRGEEVIVTRYERGVAYVRTWAAMVTTQPSTAGDEGEALQKETKDVQ